jgi:hypothetical protein
MHTSHVGPNTVLSYILVVAAAARRDMGLMGASNDKKKVFAIAISSYKFQWVFLLFIDEFSCSL